MGVKMVIGMSCVTVIIWLLCKISEYYRDMTQQEYIQNKVLQQRDRGRESSEEGKKKSRSAHMYLDAKAQIGRIILFRELDYHILCRLGRFQSPMQVIKVDFE
jgi:sortase (surface protein transpeptidase)